MRSKFFNCAVNFSHSVFTLSPHTQFSHSVFTLSVHTQCSHSVFKLSLHTQISQSVFKLSLRTQSSNSFFKLSLRTQSSNSFLTINVFACSIIHWFKMAKVARRKEISLTADFKWTQGKVIYFGIYYCTCTLSAGYKVDCTIQDEALPILWTVWLVNMYRHDHFIWRPAYKQVCNTKVWESCAQCACRESFPF